MSGGPRFPQHPLAGRDRDFVGPDGKNPFADSTPAQETPPATAVSADTAPSVESGANLFAAPRRFEPAEPTAGLYDAMLPHRGGQIFLMGLLGLLGASYGLLVVGPIVWMLMSMLSVLTLLVVSASMLLCVVTLTMARADLKAIDAGAMAPEGRRQVVLGRRCAAVGAALGVVCWGGLAYWVVARLLLAG